MADSILFWNDVANETTRVDYSSADPTIALTPEQAGPTRTSRALAIVHLAMYDAYVGASGGATYLAYSAAEKPMVGDVDAQAAVASAAALTLIALYRRQRDAIRQTHVAFLASLAGGDPKIARGIAWGELVANKLLVSRQGDGSELSEDFYAPSSEPLRHRPDPLNPSQGFLGPLWGRVKPFGITNLIADVPGSPPPAPNLIEYVKDFKEVKALGERGSDVRTAEQTTVGLFWAYDGARNIGVPPRLYNQIVHAIAVKKGSNEATNARLFAVVNVAMADAGIHTWYEKYRYDYWRPVVGIREASDGYGPTGNGDGSPETAGDGAWLPFGSPRTNQPQLGSFSPPFPAYPSGHATFGTAALHATRLELGLDQHFVFPARSDELNGTSIDENGSQRVLNVRNLTIDKAIEENLFSRVYLGVHWRFDAIEGKANGLAIATKIHDAFPAHA
jgi:Vanadium chloroperoxidase N-terminal domain/PAP2 superfamily